MHMAGADPVQSAWQRAQMQQQQQQRPQQQQQQAAGFAPFQGGALPAQAVQMVPGTLPSGGVPPFGGYAGGDGGVAAGPQQVQQLMQMGFTEQRAREALNATGGNVEQAANLLLS